MPKCYGYGRHSSLKQGMTREVQQKSCREYYDAHLKSKGVEWGGFHYDAALTGNTIFAEREQGRIVYFALKQGDYLIVASTDRLFRNKVDGFVTLDQLDKKGVRRVILDLPDLSGIDGDPEVYEMIEDQMVLYAHMYRRMLSRKMRRDNQFKRERGIPFSRSSPPGWKQVGDRLSKAYRVNAYERTIIDFMQTMHEEGMTYEQIALWYMHEEDKGRFRGKVIRRFRNEGAVRWALRAREANYPMITNLKEFTAAWRSGKITLNHA